MIFSKKSLQKIFLVLFAVFAGDFFAFSAESNAAEPEASVASANPAESTKPADAAETAAPVKSEKQKTEKSSRRHKSNFVEEKSKEPDITVITITNARQTSYKKAEDTGNDTIVLEGDVQLSVKKGNSTSEIKADSITYDRKTDMLYAEGNVEIVTSGSSAGSEKTTADSILLNTATLEGVFDGGRVVQTQSNALNLPAGSTLIVFSDIFGKGASNTIAFKNSQLTFCDDINPHWHISATRTWLLPGGEFAFFNALVYVGEVPVLYLPAFYYPKDELVFNPVFGFRNREGYFMQNTVYVFGRKPLDTSTTETSSSDSNAASNTSTSAEALKGLYNFMKPSSLKEQVLEGLILHNLDTDYKGDTTNYLKIMGDYYSNLGWMTGFTGHFTPSQKFVTSLDVSLMTGFSNTVFASGTKYYAYSPNSGETYKDKSNFIGMELPFRYGGKVALTLSNPVRLTLDFPFFSDPFFQYDFITNRQENMDWISFILENTASGNSDETVSISEYSNFAWTLTSSSSVNQLLPDFLRPYFSSFSYNLSSSIQFSSRNVTDAASLADGRDIDSRDTGTGGVWANNSPERKFYFPSQITPLSLSVNMGGTLLKVPFGQSSKYYKAQNYLIDLNKPDEMLSEKQLEEKRIAAEKDTENKSESEKEKTAAEKASEQAASSESASVFTPGFMEPVFPVLDFKAENIPAAEGFVYSLNYTFNPSIVTTMAYSSETSYLKTGSDFEWDNVKSSMYTIKTPLGLTNTLTYGGNFFSINNTFNYSPIYQKHMYINEKGVDNGGYTEEQANSLRLTDYRAEAQDISTVNTVSLMPFAYIPLFSETGVRWNSSIKLLRQEFVGTVEKPEWKYHGMDWDDEQSVTVNSLDVILGMTEVEKKFKQTLTFNNVMPPLLRQYNQTLQLVFPYVTETVSTGLQERTHEDVSYDEKWQRKPIQQTTTVGGTVLGSNLSFSENYSYNWDEYHPDSLKFSASWWGFSFAYVMSYTTGYDFVTAEEASARGNGAKIGWEARKEKEFLPYSLNLSYSNPSKTYYKWFNRISAAPGISTNLVYDLIRPTSSYFTFSPSLTFNINNFFFIKFSSTTQNSVIYRYFQAWEGHPGRVPGEENMWIDLWNSFRFDDETKRKSSGFKLKSLNMDVTHDLHDWKFNMTLSFQPRLLTENGNSYYDFNPFVTIGIVWKPMEGMKTQIKDNYGDWSFQ